jgi:diguanylate cyclase (GGDEF)-like protein
MDLQAVSRLGRAQAALIAAADDDLAHTLITEATALVTGQRGYLYSVRGENVVLICATATDAVVGTRMPVGQSCIGDVIESGQPRMQSPGSAPCNSGAKISVPVIVGGAVVQVLVVHVPNPRRIDLESVVALTKIGESRLEGIERDAEHWRQLRRIEQRLATLAGDPSRGRRRGDAALAGSRASVPSAALGSGADRLIEASPFGVLVARQEAQRWQVVSVNPTFAALRGRRAGDLQVGLDEALGLAEGEPSVDPSTMDSEGVQPQTRLLKRRDGSTFEAWLYAVAAPDVDGSRAFAVCVFDVDRQARRLRELERMAMTDPVTGLANRTRVTEVLEKSLHNNPIGTVAVMLLDLDRFKNVNDSLGHHVGDLLLVEVTQRLRASVPPGTVVSRLGGDEFLLVLQGLDDLLDVHPVAYGLLETVAEPFDLPSGHRVASSVSIGIAIADRPRQRAIDLIREADLAMYRAKDLGRNRYALCDDTMLSAADSQLSSEVVLRRGLEEGRLRLRLQPIVDIQTARPVKFEALVRLHDAERGEVSPGEFVPIAEETGLISDIDFWVIEQTLELLGTDEMLVAERHVRIAVNVSGRTLERPDFMSRLVVALQRHGVEADRLVVEITESCLLGDNRAILWTLNQLRARGAQVAIDDFGTGYSALSYLLNFEVDVLKIDQSFVARVSRDDERGTKLVGNIVRLAHDLGLAVVAEGVEEAEQADLLIGLGCDFAQGWLYGRPEPPPVTRQIGVA